MFLQKYPAQSWPFQDPTCTHLLADIILVVLLHSFPLNYCISRLCAATELSENVYSEVEVKHSKNQLKFYTHICNFSATSKVSMPLHSYVCIEKAKLILEKQYD